MVLDSRRHNDIKEVRLHSVSVFDVYDAYTTGGTGTAERATHGVTANAYRCWHRC